MCRIMSDAINLRVMRNLNLPQHSCRSNFDICVWYFTDDDDDDDSYVAFGRLQFRLGQIDTYIQAYILQLYYQCQQIDIIISSIIILVDFKL
eukprot:TRINITY_DN887_c0_g2_i2.p4 TRINITY_DN887_c0_g2~~TRINITY_DN887_c0_g2_i2.p4  ORF type:complete len:108 (-),score=3.42 TRINITY_DN887_c0_g2_i2:161-436(-)